MAFCSSWLSWYLGQDSKIHRHILECIPLILSERERASRADISYKTLHHTDDMTVVSRKKKRGLSSLLKFESREH